MSFSAIEIYYGSIYEKYFNFKLQFYILLYLEICSEVLLLISFVNPNLQTI